MSTEATLTPSGSQTVGPYFRIGLEYLLDRTPKIAGAEVAIELRGRVIDRDGKPVPDALLELWSPDGSASAHPSSANESGFPTSFRRAPTDDAGNYTVTMLRPAGNGGPHAPHLLALVFTRGLLRHLISRVYFEDEPANESDPILLAVPMERRHTLIARRDAHNSFRWDVVLQGADETVFFAW